MSKQDNLTDFLTDVADAIREKKGTVEKINPQSFSEEIRGIEGNEELVEWDKPSEKDVNFYDYDGILLYSYTWEEAEMLAEMPVPPYEHEGLIFDGWNYTIEEMKAQGDCAEIGALYVPEDGRTRIKLLATSNTVSFAMVSYGDFYVQIDDNAPILYVKNITHKVSFDSHIGNRYTIYIDMDNSKYFKMENSKGCIIEEINTAATSSQNVYAIAPCKISLPKSSGSYYLNLQGGRLRYIGGYHISGEIARSNVIERMSIRPNTTLSSVFAYGNSSVLKLVIPTGCLIEDKYFSDYQYSRKIYRLRVSKNNTTYSSSDDCNVIIKDDVVVLGCTNSIIPIGVKVIGQRAFYGVPIKELNIPQTVESILDYAFFENQSITEIIIPDSVLDIGSNAFYNTSVKKLVIGKGLTTIKASSFIYSYKLELIDFTKSEIVPILANSNAFQGIPTTCQIVVPDTLYDEWIAATNWSTYASKIVKASEYVEPTNNE